MESWVQWVTVLFGAGGVGYMLIDRFARTREQRGGDAADMVAKISDAFDKTLQTTMRYSQEVIEKMKQDDERSEQRYRELEARYAKLEDRFDEKEADRELLKEIVSRAIGCVYLKDGHNSDCPVLIGNKKRLEAKCRSCTDKGAKNRKTEQKTI